MKSVLTSLNLRHEDIIHSTSYTDINIRKVEFGAESMWKRIMKKNRKTKTDPRMSFVYGCDSSETENSALSVDMLRQLLDKVTWAMKARTRNPLGNLIWRY